MNHSGEEASYKRCTIVVKHPRGYTPLRQPPLDAQNLEMLHPRGDREWDFKLYSPEGIIPEPCGYDISAIHCGYKGVWPHTDFLGKIIAQVPSCLLSCRVCHHRQHWVH